MLDRRVERTKRDLKNALLSLIGEKQSLSAITITDIAKLANYNRATFYAHYVDKDALLNEVMEEAISGFIDAFREPYKGKTKVLEFQKLTSKVIKIFDYVEENSLLFSLLFNNKVFPGFQQKLSYVIEDIFKKDFEYVGLSSSEINKDLYYRTQANSIIGNLAFWIESDFKYDSKYLAEQLLHQNTYTPSIIKIKYKDD
jgi:AcrR family transcriptional regulator